eukprot:CAMPEP_0196807986 /NCGR_PEP_ID=MMETSP1362-20130617/7955_1 /TAXON_ID=163516 /ORGANISM="Leptocylindrus danicus, Strain CCMP1856" /LENGTH=513 /DNA_ID=CAMNT_0042182115 /DNA_START=62 /DNA_END=1599 /DNA_ORIENTATION=+
MASLLKAPLPARLPASIRLLNATQPIKVSRIVSCRCASVPRSLVHVPSSATATVISQFSTASASITTPSPSSSTTSVKSEDKISKLQQRELKGVGIRWIKQYIKLCEFKHKHGHCDMSTKYNRFLREWCNKQRENYDSGKLKKSQIRALEDEGFVWDPDQMCFDERVAELEKFKSEHNHCLVPTERKNQKHACSEQLRYWVSLMRSQYAKSLLDPEKIRVLDNMGFVWNVHDHAWNAKFEEMERFVYWFGHCAVPFNYKPSPGLGRWARFQIIQYEKHQRGEPSLLTEGRLEKLEKIKFPIGLEDNLSNEKWDIMFQQLKEYKTEHDHFYVEYSHQCKLGRWVHNQRHLYACGNLPDNLVRQLNDIGFHWDTKNISGAWINMFHKLKKYKEAQVAKKSDRYPPYHTSLGRWIFKQRKQYRLMLSGGKSNLTQEKIDLLKSIGFEFTPSIFKSWEERFEMLKKYKEEYGDCLVPARSSELGMWVANQRAQYTQIQEGKKSNLTQDRIDLLDGLG